MTTDFPNEKASANDYITKNFQYKEFFCKGTIEPPGEYAKNVFACATELQKVRDIIGKPIIVNSGYRTKAWNAANGGAINSFHLYGKACDTRAVGMSIKDYLHYILRYTIFNGIGINVAKNFIHADLRKDFTIIHY